MTLPTDAEQPTNSTVPPIPSEIEKDGFHGRRIAQLANYESRVPIGQDDEGQEVVLTYEQRRQHTYVIGVNGTGKSALLRNIAYADMMQPGHGLCVIDPHGDLVADILSLVPENRLDDVILFDPSDVASPFSLGVFSPVPPKDEIGRVASEIVAIFRKILGPAWTPEIEAVLQNVTLTLLCRPEGFMLNGEPFPAALDEIPALLAMEHVPEEDVRKPPWQRRATTYRSQFYRMLQQQDLIPVWEFWTYNFDTLTPRPRSELTFSALNEVRRFLSNPTVRNIVGQTQSKLDLSEVMRDGRILLVNLSKGRLGESNSSFLGSIFIAKLVLAVFARADSNDPVRRPFHLIVDEFQNFATASFPSLLAEGRKYNVDLVIAHQYRDQLRDWVQGATVNAGNIISFRLGGDDSMEMAREFDSTPPTPDEEFSPVYRRWSAWSAHRRTSWSFLLEDTTRLPSVIEHLDSNPVLWEPAQRAVETLADQARGQEVRERLFDIAERIKEHEVLPTDHEVVRFVLKDCLETASEEKYAQHRVPYPTLPNQDVRDDRESGPLFEKVPGRPRAYSDMVQQISNELSHLPNFHARCKLAGWNTPPLECAFQTQEWPASSKATDRESEQRRNQIGAIRKSVEDKFTRPRSEVEQDFQNRYRTMLASIGSAWEPGGPLPPPDVRYDQDDE